MKVLKKCLLIFCMICLFCTPSMAATVTDISTKKIEYLPNGDYIEVTITETPTKALTKSGTKTANYKNSAGSTMWSVSVKGNFSYVTGKSCTCTSASGSSASYSSSWTVSSTTSSKSGNSATASATGTHYMSGNPMESLSRSVTLYCDSYGNLS